MAKVDITKIRLGVTAITKNIVAMIPNKAGTMSLHKHDVTSDFLKCIIDYGKNSRWNITGEGSTENEYEVACLEKKGFKKVLFSRKDVIKLLTEAVKDGVGETISLDEWAAKKLL